MKKAQIPSESRFMSSKLDDPGGDRPEKINRFIITILASASIFSLLACGMNSEIPTLRLQSEQYLGVEEARGHHCIDQDRLIHTGFWELMRASAYQAVGRIYVDRTRDRYGNIVEGGYMDPDGIQWMEADFRFRGLNRAGRRLLSADLLLWVKDPWFHARPPQLSPFLTGGTFESRPINRPDGVSEDATIIRHYAEGYMDEGTCEIIHYRSY